MSRDHNANSRDSTRLSPNGVPEQPRGGSLLVLTADDVPRHLAAHLAWRWTTRTNGSTDLPPTCGHNTSSHAWARAYLDRLLCPECFDLLVSMAVHLRRTTRFRDRCDHDECGQRARVIAQLPVRLRRRPGRAEILLLGFYCAGCAEPPDDWEAA